MTAFGFFWFVVLYIGCLFMFQTVHVVANQTPSASGNQTKCFPVKSTVGHSLLADHYVPYTTLFPNGTCAKTLGNNMVYGSPDELKAREMSSLRARVAIKFIEMNGGIERIKRADNIPSSIKNPVLISRTCLNLNEDISCHDSFPQYRISSAHPQSVCREECERLRFHLCKKEVKLIEDMNNNQKKYNYPYYWGIINCTQLPWRDVSRTGKVEPDCYYHDAVRDQLDKVASVDCYYGIGKGYNGNISITRSGYICQSWSSQCPHQKKIINMYPELENESNFCRNLGGLGTEGPWCFTTNPNVTWEYCAVPKCPQRGPSLAPTFVKARSINSTAIKVTWDKIPILNHQGVLQEYNVECAKANSSEWLNKKVQVKIRTFIFIELEKYTNYSCRVRGKNNFGNGIWSNLVNVSTDEDVPGAPPQGIKAWNTNSTSLHVMWEPVPRLYRHGRIVGYIVRWRPHDDTKEQNQTTPARSLSLTGLRKFTNYSIDVSAVTQVGSGPASIPVTVKTDEDEPSAPPQGVKAWNTSSTSILVTWEPVPLPNQHGRIVGYIVRWRSDHGKEQTQKIPGHDRSLLLTRLRKFTEYSINVSAVTRMGAGPASAPVTVKTDEDVPSRSVENITVFRKDHAITVTWGKVLPGYEHGIIKGYKILLTAKLANNQDITIENTTNQQKIVFDGLEPNTNYRLWVSAYTAKGDGPKSNETLITTGKTSPQKSEDKQQVKPDTYTIIGIAAGFVAVVILVAVAVLIYFRPRKHPNRENVRQLVAPYAVAQVEDILEYPVYEEINENGARYKNLNMDGTLNIPPHLRDVFINFEPQYENLRYQRLEGIKPRQTSISGLVDEHGRPIYDVLKRLVVMEPDPVAVAKESVNNN